MTLSHFKVTGIQTREVQIVFRFVPTVAQWYMVATHIKMIKQSMLCVTGVYLRDITNTSFVILHLNVSQLSIYTLLICFIIAVIYLFIAFFCSGHVLKSYLSF